MEFSEEIKDLYFKLQRKNSGEPREYTMTEIGKISRKALKIIEKNNPDHGAIPAFNGVLARVEYFNGYGASSEFIENIEEIKELAMQAFQEFFDKE